MFRPNRSFSALSLLSMAVTTLALTLFYVNASVGELRELGEQMNVGKATMMSNVTGERLLAFRDVASSLPPGDIRALPATRALSEEIMDMMRGNAVVKVKFYGLSGKTLYSSEPAQIGEDKSDNAGFVSARSGTPASELTRRNTFSAFEGVIEDRDVLSTYIPMRRAGSTQIEGVFEIYTDVTPLLAKISQSRYRVAGVVGGSLLALYLALFWVMRRAEGLLRKQSDDLQNSAVASERLAERKRSEEARARLAAIVENSNDAIYSRTLDGTILSWNSGAEQMLGYSAAEMIGNRVSHAIPPGRPPRVALNNEMLRQGEMFTRESERLTRDGRVIDVLSSYSPIRDDAGSIIGASVILRDVTARKQAEQVYQVRESQLREAQRIAGIGSWEWDVGGDTITWSEGLYLMLGLGLDVPAPTFKTLSGYYTPQGWECLSAEVSKSVVSGTPYELELEMYRADGTICWTSTRGEAVRGPDGNIVKLRGTVHDITARKHSDGLLLAAKAEAEAANEAKSRFLAAASHDLRQPLTALSMYVGTLSRTASSGDQRLVSRIEGCVHGLSVLLSNLFDLSKLDSGAAAVKPVEFSIRELFDTLETVYGGEAAGKGLRLRLRPSFVRVRTDPYLLQRILGNLIANAIKFTERGGVLVGCRRHAGRMWVEVWDTGIGIADDKTEFIFEEFAQLGDGARNRGSGLGLSIVDKTAALLGLQVRIRSRPGRGSLFAVELPAVFDIAQNLVPTPAPERAPRKLRIGLVEDNSTVLHALTLALSSTGHDVVSSTTGMGLLQNLAGQAPQIIISDYRLAAGETGSDVIAAMRGAFGEELPGFVLTGNTDPALVRSMSEQRIAVHFKPVEVDALEAAIMEATGFDA